MISSYYVDISVATLPRNRHWEVNGKKTVAGFQTAWSSCHSMTEPLATPRRIGNCSDYDSLHRAIRARVEELGVSREAIDEAAKAFGNWPDRYASKVLAPIPIKGFGRQSLGPMLAVLGLTLAVEVVEERPPITDSPFVCAYKAHMHKPLKHGLANAPEIRTLGRKALRARLKEIGKKGGKRGGPARAKALTPAKRRRIARKAALARWKRQREVSALASASLSAAATSAPGTLQTTPSAARPSAPAGIGPSRGSCSRRRAAPKATTAALG